MPDTCTNCNAILSPTSTSCPSCGSPRRSQSSGGANAGGFCGSCGTALASKYSPCPKCGHVKTTFAPPPQSGSFCGGCGGPLASKYSPCPKCGHVKTTFAPPPQYSSPGVQPQNFLYKSSGTTNLLSILCSLLIATNGVGHLYLGQIGKGIGLMIGGWILLTLCLIPWFFLGMMSASYYAFSFAGEELIILGILALVFGISYLILFIWSMIDANKQCKIYNQFVSQNGRPPW